MTAARKLNRPDQDDPGYWARQAAIASEKLLKRLRAEHDFNMKLPEPAAVECIKPWLEPAVPEPKAVVIPISPVKSEEESASTISVPLTVKKIMRAVSAHFNVPLVRIEGPSRLDSIVMARHVGMYLAKELTKKSLPEIGRVFGGRDHTTVLHGVRKITALVRTDEKLAFNIALLIEDLTGKQG